MEAGQKVTWDCVWFGSYPQSEVTKEDAVYAKLESASDWNIINEITIDKVKYRRMRMRDATYWTSKETAGYYYWENETTWHYFRYEPIKWRVLNTDGKRALLLSDVALDDQPYHDVLMETTWESSILHIWFNEYFENRFIECWSFLDAAFSMDERKAIQSTPLANESNPYYGTDGGKNTKDKVFLLGASDVYGTDRAKNYGFVKEHDVNDEAKRCKCSDYAKAMGTMTATTKDYTGNCWWWLRTPGKEKKMSMGVSVNGWVSESGSLVTEKNNGIRPAIYLDLSFSGLYSYAGTVCSKEKKNMAFDRSLYRADVLSDLTIPSSKTWKTDVNQNRFCSMLLYGLEKENIATPAKGWEYMQVALSSLINNPSNLLEFALREEDMYQALIFAVLSEDFENTALDKMAEVEAFASKVVELTADNKLYSDLWKALDANKEWKSWSQSKKEKFVNDMKKELEDTELGMLKQFTDASDDIMLISGTLEEILIYAGNYLSLYLMSDAVKEVVNILYEQCPDRETALKKALGICNETIREGADEFTADMQAGMIRIAGRKAISYGMDKLWSKIRDNVIAENPKVGIIIASYETSTFLTETLFKTDSTVEKYFNMVAMDAFNKVVQNTYTILEGKYRNARTKKNAEIYLSAADIMYRSIDTDCDYAISYAETISSSMIGKVSEYLDNMQGKNTFTQMSEAIKTIQKSYKIDYFQVLTTWVNYLEADGYGAYYEKYADILEEDVDKLVKTYQIACPVDIYVYDKSGTLAASVIANRPGVYVDDIDIVVENDRKEIHFSGNGHAYTIKYVGTDKGSMDIMIQEYQENKVVRTANFNRLDLEKGKTYTSEYNDKILEQQEYRLNDGTGDIISDYDSIQEEKVVKSHITIENGVLLKDGIPSVALDGGENEKIEIMAYVPEGYAFEGWFVSDSSAFLDDSGKINTYLYVGKKDCVVRPKLRKKMPPVGTIIKDKKTNGQYKVITSEPQKVTLQYLKPMNAKNKSVSIANSIKINGVSCKVTSIAKNALKGNQKVKTVTIGKYVTSIGDKAFYKCSALTKVTIPANVGNIGKQAFYGCKNLKSITMKSKVLKKIGSYALKGIHKKAIIKVPKAKLKSYKKLLKGTGQSKSVKITKY